jgi:hypothetical protein
MVCRAKPGFCETDLAQPLFQYIQLPRHPGQRFTDESFMLGGQAFEGSPPRPLGLTYLGLPQSFA